MWLILKVIYFMVPAYFANMAPVFFRKFPFLNYPIDFGKNLKTHRIFGDHKTFRGLFVAVLFGMLFFYFQKLLYGVFFFNKISLINYPEHSIFLGALLGFGAIFGDLVKSFFKRRKDFKPGKSWIPWDQIDFILGAIIVSLPFLKLTLFEILVLLVITPLLHIGANHIGYYLKIKKSKW